MTRLLRHWMLFVCFAVCSQAYAATNQSLTVYFIDVEGGQSTLVVAPSGKSVLIDTGFPGHRDASRIMSAVADAHLSQIDYLLITHFHNDHIGGYKTLADQIPIKHYVDHGATVQPEQNSESKQAYDLALPVNPHVIARPGDHLLIGGGADWLIVSSAGKTLLRPVPGDTAATKLNRFCSQSIQKDIDAEPENAQSVGSLIEFGKFRMLDLGDLLWNLEGQLACPKNLIGRIDVLVVTHHGSNWSGNPALIYALHPRAAVMNNAVRKGGNVETFRTLENAPNPMDVWQLHWSANALLEHNSANFFIANIETPEVTSATMLNPPPEAMPGVRPSVIGNPDHDPAFWIKLSASSTGDFTIRNSRTGLSKLYSGD